ncbi:MAG: DUF1007 family protein [Sulfitobacter sp.]
MREFFTALTMGAALVAAPLGAHPHIFVDTGLELIVDGQGRATHVRVTWAYDALYSLLVTEDMGLDADGDAVLSPAEEAQLRGFDANWIDGFEGDLEARFAGAKLALSGPQEPTAKMREGRIVTTHLRQIETPPDMAKGALEFAPYDPTFYTAYDVTMGSKVTGRGGCAAALNVPEVTDDLLALKNDLSEIDEMGDAEAMGGSNVGALFATKVQFTCAP